ncbi:MAG TPA: RNA polymerase sigma-70 factor [Gemmatimonadales bacterium]|nr:RNA polymerase sigma-70 factor [Gemmatimonadales bacterium]
MSASPEPSDHPAGAAEAPDPYVHWIARIARGDAQAFEALFRALYDRLCAFAESYVGSPQAAEEIVDDVFLNLWVGREQLRIRSSVLSYLFVAVRNKSLTHLSRANLERRYAERVRAQEPLPMVDGVQEVEEQAATNELLVLVQEAIRQLPPRARQTYVLYYQQHLSYAEIAGIMGVSVKTVENQLSRALKILWLRLKDRLL